ncbi:fumarylacetoacetate hydrolase family protein [Glaciimonas sp. PAMC28666]|uniref:fumarylacetoacetate hydrolase family protein n=1 Tax=Glaciimonas sp. PAMC28666 TaxID=2807626 RepID=UPI0019664116|nr:fumarylacetoacetate hydrolase family protein [Glaciimonas sp. PAMC28666]QRX81723.1 fumarylacetoacetate hydrolase family protein [Glaciimonas sp. PAMC28666]
MKLVTYLYRGSVSIGKVMDGEIIDFPASDPTLPRTMLAFLEMGPQAMDRARQLNVGNAVTVPFSAATLLAPISNPSKFLAIGMNYQKHVEEAREGGLTIPNVQVWFNKQVSCINGPYNAIHMPTVSDMLDYEVELGVVIGRRCRNVSVEDARSVIAGYMVCNDVTVRDWQLRSPTMTIGKSFDTTGPTGPWIVTDDEIEDPHALTMQLFVNGEQRQHESTAGMVYNIYQQIAHLSTAMTLEPGDILATGTPSGVGMAMKPPQFLKVGDVVRAQIDAIGMIENTVIAV